MSNQSDKLNLLITNLTELRKTVFDSQVEADRKFADSMYLKLNNLDAPIGGNSLTSTEMQQLNEMWVKNEFSVKIPKPKKEDPIPES